MQEGSMPNTIIDELNSKIEKAISYKLIPNQRYTEIEFTVDTNGQASVIEFWHSANRLDSANRLPNDYNSVKIPSYILKEFVFKKFKIQPSSLQS
tara:strand:- start:24 stop:308 length:285 start_codon:yes stop_codon:yes gene_type:complete